MVLGRIGFLVILLWLMVSAALAATKTETLRPTANTGTATNPASAYDNNTGTAATITYDTDGAPRFTVLTWQTKSIMMGYRALTLKVLYSATAATNDTYQIQYSTNGGTSWTSMVGPTSAAATNQTLTATLTATQDLTQLRVGIFTDRVSGPDGQSVSLFEVWTEGTYNTAAYVIN